MWSGPALHVVRWEFESALDGGSFGTDSALPLGHGEEALFAAPLGDLLALARAPASEHGPLSWVTTQQHPDVLDLLQRRVREAIESGRHWSSLHVPTA
jgi:hypothetical protein